MIISNLASKRKRQNEVQHHKKHPSSHVKPRQRHRNYHVFDIASVTIYAADCCAHAFFSARSTHKWSGISESRPFLAGNERNVVRYKVQKHLVASNKHRRYGLRAVPLCHVAQYSIHANIRQHTQGTPTVSVVATTLMPQPNLPTLSPALPTGEGLGVGLFLHQVRIPKNRQLS